MIDGNQWQWRDGVDASWSIPSPMEITMPDQDKPKPSFIDSLANLVSDIVSDANLELVQKAWFDSPLTHDGRFSDYYQTPTAAKDEPTQESPAPDERAGPEIDR
jgi:hypothetical protein